MSSVIHQAVSTNQLSRIILSDITHTLQTLLKVISVGLGVLEDLNLFAIDNAISCLHSHAKSIASERLQLAILLDTLHGEGTNAETDIVAGETVYFEFGINLFTPLHRNGIAVQSLDMRIEHLVALTVDCSAEDVPQMVDSLRNDFDRVTRITTDQQRTIMSHDFILELRQDIIDQIPVVVGIRHHAETHIRIQLGQRPADKSDLVAIDSEVRTHHTMLGADSAKRNRLFFTITAIHFFQIRNCRNSGRIQEAQAPTSA